MALIGPIPSPKARKHPNHCSVPPPACRRQVLAHVFTRPRPEAVILGIEQSIASSWYCTALIGCLKGRVRVNIEAWLTNLGLDQYAEAFAKNEIDGETLPALTGTT